MEGKGWFFYAKIDQFNYIHLSAFPKRHVLSTKLLLLPSPSPPQNKNTGQCSPVKTPAGLTGTVNAGFGTTWSREAAEGRSYQQQLAIQELQLAMQGTKMPKTDDTETLGAEKSNGWTVGVHPEECMVVKSLVL